MDCCNVRQVSSDDKYGSVSKKTNKNKNNKKDNTISYDDVFQSGVIVKNRYDLLSVMDNEVKNQDGEGYICSAYQDFSNLSNKKVTNYDKGLDYSIYNKNLRFKSRVFWNSKFKKTNNNIVPNNEKNFCNNKIEICNSQVFRKNAMNKDYYINDNYLNLKFKRCNNKRCKTCCMLSETQLDKDSMFIFCKTYNCIYNLKCNECGLNYIGQTSNTINIRINQHRSDTKNYKKNKNINNNIEIGHFNLHGFDKIEISIIKIVPNLKRRLWWENYFINFFNTIYPYGLNVMYFNKNVMHMNKSINAQFFYKNNNVTLNRHFKSKKAGRKRERRKLTEIKESLIKLSNDFDKDFNLKKIKSFMFGLNKKEIKNIRVLFEETELNTHGWDLISDLYRFIFKKFKLKGESDNQLITEYCTFLYMNKNYDKCNFSSIMEKHKYSFPIKNIKIKRAFKYNKQLGRMIFNYNNIKETYDMEKCCCDKYINFIDKHHGHIITGDLNIIEDIKLRETMFKGTKHRLIINNNDSNIKVQIKKDLDGFILKMAIKYSMPIEAFNEYKIKILEEICDFDFSTDREIRFRDLKTKIEDLQKDFVIVYIDKVPSNFALICKYYYSRVIKEHIQDNDAYMDTNQNNRELDNRIKAFHKKLNLQCQNIKYPHIFLTPKFHKNPIKFRSVTNGSNTYISKTGKIFQNYLQKVINQLKCENKTFIINNSLEVVRNIKDINIFSLHSYDFQDLFNSIDIKDLLEVLFKIYEDFNLKTLLNVTKFKNLINIILKENYISFDNKFYKQIKGIPQGGPASNALANLYLHYYEINKNNNSFVIFRYIDDLLLCSKEEADIPTIDFYPKYLNLIKTNESSSYAEFLDLSLKIVNNKINTVIYDKRKDFEFKINKLPFWNSNISRLIFKNIISNFIHRCNSIITDFKDRKDEIQMFLNNAIKYDFPRSFLSTYIDKKYLKNSKQC